MKKVIQVARASALALLCTGAGALRVPNAAAQDPVITPIIAETAAPVLVKAVKPAPRPSGLSKFEGYVMHANPAQVTVKAKGNDMAIQTFALSEAASSKMQQIIDKGGYQFGDKITVYYDSQSMKAIKFKGKPSRPL